MNFFPTKQFLFFISFLLYSFQTTGQEIPEIDEKDVPDFSITRNQTFDGSSLWGYMNGGADIYLEYGFEILRVQEFIKDDETIKMELYKMGDPLSAFGIYSIKTFKCRQDSLLTAIDCLNRYQYQILYGDYYIQIISESGSEKAKEMMLEIGGKMLAEIEPEDLTLPVSYLTDSLNISPANIKMLKGPLGLLNKASGLSKYFDKISDYQIWYAKTEKGDEKLKYYEILFKDPDTKNRLIKGISRENHRIIMADENRIVFIQ
ncbi:MAG: hypothetical protein K9G58_11625 [Bacteroidales bacterium]|nr:hypothetical protein [Bacteroidales bacterium]MCF8387907.1 hypothetical protein [Bacteroidales bacterium]MCF8398813.1 hypothetical protein [Bacteroidales bacterium]